MADRHAELHAKSEEVHGALVSYHLPVEGLVLLPVVMVRNGYRLDLRLRVELGKEATGRGAAKVRSD